LSGIGKKKGEGRERKKEARGLAEANQKKVEKEQPLEKTFIQKARKEDEKGEDFAGKGCLPNPHKSKEESPPEKNSSKKVKSSETTGLEGKCSQCEKGGKAIYVVRKTRTNSARRNGLREAGVLHKNIPSINGGKG